MKKLKTLKEHNSEFIDSYFLPNTNLPGNGIECPNCGSELVDTNTNMTLLSNPPQKDIACLKPGCNYKGYRYTH